MRINSFRTLAFAASTLVVTLVLGACGGSGGGGNSPTDPSTPLIVKALELANPDADLNSVCNGVGPGQPTFTVHSDFSGPMAKAFVQVMGPAGQLGDGTQVSPGNNLVDVRAHITGAAAAGNVIGIRITLRANDGQEASKIHNCPGF
jgi:hypothetical protein